MVCIYSTPRKINIEPDKKPLKEESHHSSKPSFACSMLIFGGVPTFTKKFSAEHVRGPRVQAMVGWKLTLHLVDFFLNKNCIGKYTSWWFQPSWKICSSNYIISPGIRVKIKKIFELPPVRKCLGINIPYIRHGPLASSHSPNVVCFSSLPSQVTTCIAFQLLWRLHLGVSLGGENGIVVSRLGDFITQNL